MHTLLALAGLSGCGSPSVDPQAASPKMDDVALLSRLSLDLRGTRPSMDEIKRVEDDPAQLAVITDELLASGGFERRVRDLFAEVFLTRQDLYLVQGADYGLDDEARFVRSVSDEVLQMVGHVAANDLPYTELVVGDWTMADETLAKVFPVDYPADATGWQKVHYTDGRPDAGVLATNSLWWRYPSTASNANRKRANAVSTLFLCHDYLTRPIDFDRDVDLLDSEAVADAIRTDPGCVACHATIEPLAGYLFGFFYYDESNPDEVAVYHPERELRWQDYTGVAPGYFGTPGSGLADLGRQLAGDPRFPDCAVQHVYEGLLRRPVTGEDLDRLTTHREAFIDGGLTLRALFGSIVADARYTAGSVDTEGYVSRKMVTPDLLASQVEGLTGFRWQYAGYDMLQNDQVGLRTLAGGLPATGGTASATSPNTTVLLVQERLAEAAASYAVEQALAGERSLFTKVDLGETLEDAAGRASIVAQLQQFHFRFYGRRVAEDGEEIAANLELWDELYAVSGQDVAATWAGVLTALLRDPDFLFY